MDPFGPSVRHAANTALSAPGFPHHNTSQFLFAFSTFYPSQYTWCAQDAWVLTTKLISSPRDQYPSSSRFDVVCRHDRRSIDHMRRVSRWHTMLRFFSSLHQAAHFFLGYLMLCFFSAWTVVHKMSRYATCVFFEQAIHLCVLLDSERVCFS